MLRAVQTASQGGEDCFQVTAEQSRGIEPQTWKYAAPEQSIVPRCDFTVIALPQFPPRRAVLVRDPNQVLTHAIPPVSRRIRATALPGLEPESPEWSMFPVRPWQNVTPAVRDNKINVAAGWATLIPRREGIVRATAPVARAARVVNQIPQPFRRGANVSFPLARPVFPIRIRVCQGSSDFSGSCSSPRSPSSLASVSSPAA